MEIPSGSEVAAKTYFLQPLNTPVVIWSIRLSVIAIAVFLVCAYLYAMKKRKKAQEEDRRK